MEAKSTNENEIRMIGKRNKTKKKEKIKNKNKTVERKKKTKERWMSSPAIGHG